MKVPCICIDAKNKPKEIPLNMWSSEGIEYHIIHVYYLRSQGIQGVELEEVKLKNCDPYNSYRITRFAFRVEDVVKLIELMKECTELNEIDINKLLEETLKEEILTR